MIFHPRGPVRSRRCRDRGPAVRDLVRVGGCLQCFAAASFDPPDQWDLEWQRSEQGPTLLWTATPERPSLRASCPPSSCRASAAWSRWSGSSRSSRPAIGAWLCGTPGMQRARRSPRLPSANGLEAVKTRALQDRGLCAISRPWSSADLSGVRAPALMKTLHRAAAARGQPLLVVCGLRIGLGRISGLWNAALGRVRRDRPGPGRQRVARLRRLEEPPQTPADAPPADQASGRPARLPFRRLSHRATTAWSSARWRRTA